MDEITFIYSGALVFDISRIVEYILLDTFQYTFIFFLYRNTQMRMRCGFEI